MKKAYFAIATMNEIGKQYACVGAMNAGNNLLAFVHNIPDAYVIHLCNSRREAVQIVEEWNKSYIQNGTNAY